ncbi:hypothetical protein B566_EDAN009214 [Ephemera danica]|nr:hypothetical protein B566_EDAN009214 [Ephemera danica]
MSAPRYGRNTFLTGFGLGFLAFALKKLLLPVFIGAQIIKSVLIAMFLPTLLSGIGKFLGKSTSNVFGASSAAPSEDFDFKDNYDPSSYDTAASTNTAAFTYPQQTPQNRFENALDTYTNPSKYYLTGTDTSNTNKLTTNQYSLQSLYRRPGTTQYRRPQSPTHSNLDFTAFQKIPSASLMLSEYDPFYSPLLSRLDSIFKQMGYDQSEEACREKLVCKMYKDPAKYVPYSNLVSAQLSRELNELHKPNGSPGILRFFRYMKAAKVGQDGSNCEETYAMCTMPDLQESGSKATEGGILGAASPPMVQTYHEINKLVQARRLAKQLGFPAPKVYNTRRETPVSDVIQDLAALSLSLARSRSLRVSDLSFKMWVKPIGGPTDTLNQIY